MDTSKLRKFAQEARRKLLAQVEARLKTVLKEGSLARRESAKTVAALEARIAETSEKQVIEQAAYIWFNRFCALRFMDVNRYTTIGTVSPADGFLQPEILTEAKQGVIDETWNVDRKEVLGLLDGTKPSSDPQQEAYRLLLVAVCNHYNSLMPFMFEEIADFTELLMPDDLLSDNSVLTDLRQALYLEICSPEHTEQSVEVIGWLYQFYISEKKDDVFAALKKGKKITPENIPAATQLFTPHWIVRYLVENSLGRLWMLNHPDSRLIEQMDYYIRPEEPETDFLRISSPEEIKICDPACGSGHMLTYAFDLLYAIYEEQGYQATDIPLLILTHNLYGIEIDQRAGALAAFALTMKAREKYRRFLTGGKVVQPNICVLENISIDPEDLSAYMDKVGRDLFSGGLQGVVNQWEEADNFGSLIRPLVTDVSEVLELLRERQMGEDLFLAGVHQKVLKALRQADYLSPKYHVVVANSPYMGSKGFDVSLKSFMDQHFANAKADLFSAFIYRVSDLSLENAHLGVMTPFVWMFIAAYEELRRYLIDELFITSLIQLEYSGFAGATVPICTFTICKSSRPKTKGTYIRLADFRGPDQQASRTLEAIRNPECGWLFRIAASEFKRISGSPISFWISEDIRSAFERMPALSDNADLKFGLTTRNNDLFVRQWFEVSQARCGYGFETAEAAAESGLKWFPLDKRGGYRKWYGNSEAVVNWQHGGKDIHEYSNLPMSYSGAPVRAKQFYFRPGITWGAITSSKLSIRWDGPGFILSNAGLKLFTASESLRLEALSILNSPIATTLLGAISETINFDQGVVARVPVPEMPRRHGELIRSAIDVSKVDWDEHEFSWDFSTCSLLAFGKGSLQSTYGELRDLWHDRTESLAALEASNARVVAECYSLDWNETTSSDAEVTLFANPRYRYDDDKSDSELESLLLADTMREFISYAVGCMLGRYSLDKPGLILANQGETADDYRQQIPEPTFAPDEDNVIPLLDGDWFEDDITERFKAFLKLTFGTQHYEENLTFLENALYPDNLTGKKRKTIRDYFLKEFYNHHIKLYKKRPIYWLFSSPKGTFNALIYMHRYRPDTVSVVLKYLRDFQTKLLSQMMHQQSIADSVDAKPADKTKALKQVTQLTKDLKELADYERKVIYPLASQRIEIDLDNGVKHNYPLFGEALKKIPGLDAKEDE